MKTIKKLSTLLLLLMVTFAGSSCSEDDDRPKEIIPGPPTGTEIRYRITASTNMITAISYRKSDNNMEAGFLNIDSQTDWTKTIVVQKPFTTRLDIKFKNTTTNVQNYAVEIFVDGVLANTQTGTVAVAPSPPVNEDDPFPTVSDTKTFIVE